MPDPVADRYSHLAGKAASEWAQRTLQSDHASVEEQTVAAVVLDLRAQVSDLRERVDELGRLAFNLGGDLLHTLEAEMQEQTGEADDNAMVPVGYAARGWLRDNEVISLATCSEGLLVTAWLKSLPENHFARPETSE